MGKFVIYVLASLAICWVVARFVNLSQTAFAMGGFAVSWMAIAFLVVLFFTHKVAGGK